MDIATLLKRSPLPSLDTELIVAFVLDTDRSWLLAHGEHELTHEQSSVVEDLIERRKNAEPLAYIIGKKEFYGREFYVNEDTLIPRPATEGLVDLVLEGIDDRVDAMVKTDNDIVAIRHFFDDETPCNTVIDVGCGSGCIAVTLALEQPDLRVIGTDLSPGALRVAKATADVYGCDIEWREGDLLEPVEDHEKPFFVVSNPPYIPENTELMDDVAKYEPHEALFSGKDGMDHIRALIAQCQRHPECIGLAIECMQDQAPEVHKLLWT